MAAKGVETEIREGPERGADDANEASGAVVRAGYRWPSWGKRHFRELAENAMEGIARISPEGGVIEYCNPAYARVLGLTTKEVVGRSFFEFVEGEDEREDRRQRGLRVRGVASRYEVAVTAAGGERRVLLRGGYPLYGADGSYEGAVQTVADVTERRRAEEALKKSEERFRLVARATGEAIWDNDLLTGVQEWDGATEALFGYPAHVGRTGSWWEGRIHPEDRERVLSGLDAVMYGSGEAWEDEYRFRRADGSYACVEDRGFVVRDEQGRPVRMVGSMRDVTARREAEAALRESEERYRFAFEEAPMGMAHVTSDGRWLRVNRRLCGMSGYAEGELLRMTYVDVIPPEDAGAARERVGRLLAGEIEPYTVERRCVRKDGSRVWVNLSVSLVRKASGEPGHFFLVAEDITERKLEELVPDPLTSKEIEVLHLVSKGLKNAQIARELTYSVHTIKLHMQRIFTKLKLGVRTRQQAVARAVDIGLVKPRPVSATRPERLVLASRLAKTSRSPLAAACLPGEYYGSASDSGEGRGEVTQWN